MNTNTSCPYCKTSMINAWPDASFLRCPTCQLLVRNGSFSKHNLKKLYISSWSDPFQNIDETGATTDELSEQYSIHLLNSLNIGGFHGLKIMDFGAGRGSMSIALSKAGADVFAIEPFGSDYLLNIGVPTYRDIKDIPKETKFDGIVTLDVIEHLDEPWSVLNSLMDFLVPGGWIFIATPNSNSLNAD